MKNSTTLNEVFYIFNILERKNVKYLKNFTGLKIIES